MQVVVAKYCVLLREDIVRLLRDAAFDVVGQRTVEKHVTAILDKLGLAPTPDDHCGFWRCSPSSAPEPFGWSGR